MLNEASARALTEAEQARKQIAALTIALEDAHSNIERLLSERSNMVRETAAAEKAIRERDAFARLLKYMVFSKFVLEFRTRKQLLKLHVLLRSLSDLALTDKVLRDSLANQPEVQMWLKASQRLRSVRGRIPLRVILNVLMEVEHVVHATIVTMLESNAQLRGTSASLCERNAALTNHCMEIEQQLADAKKSVQSMERRVETREDAIRGLLLKQRNLQRKLHKSQAIAALFKQAAAPAAGAEKASAILSAQKDASTTTAAAAARASSSLSTYSTSAEQPPAHQQQHQQPAATSTTTTTAVRLGRRSPSSLPPPPQQHHHHHHHPHLYEGAEGGDSSQDDDHHHHQTAVLSNTSLPLPYPSYPSGSRTPRTPPPYHPSPLTVTRPSSAPGHSAGYLPGTGYSLTDLGVSSDSDSIPSYSSSHSSSVVLSSASSSSRPARPKRRRKRIAEEAGERGGGYEGGTEEDDGSTGGMRSDEDDSEHFLRAIEGDMGEESSEYRSAITPSVQIVSPVTGRKSPATSSSTPLTTTHSHVLHRPLSSSSSSTTTGPSRLKQSISPSSSAAYLLPGYQTSRPSEDGGDHRWLPLSSSSVSASRSPMARPASAMPHRSSLTSTQSAATTATATAAAVAVSDVSLPSVAAAGKPTMVSSHRPPSSLSSSHYPSSAAAAASTTSTAVGFGQQIPPPSAFQLRAAWLSPQPQPQLQPGDISSSTSSTSNLRSPPKPPEYPAGSPGKPPDTLRRRRKKQQPTTTSAAAGGGATTAATSFSSVSSPSIRIPSVLSVPHPSTSSSATSSSSSSATTFSPYRLASAIGSSTSSSSSGSGSSTGGSANARLMAETDSSRSKRTPREPTIAFDFGPGGRAAVALVAAGKPPTLSGTSSTCTASASSSSSGSRDAALAQIYGGAVFASPAAAAAGSQRIQRAVSAGGVRREVIMEGKNW